MWRVVLAAVVAVVVGFLATAPVRAAGVIKWEQCGGGNADFGSGAGVVELAAGGPPAAAVVSALADGVGLLRSDDLGRTWTPLNNDVAKDACCVTASPADGRVVYAGRRTAGQGLLRSTDAGATWSPVATSAAGLASDDVQSIAFAPGDSQVMLLGHRDGAAISASTDGGKTWRACPFAQPDKAIKSQLVFAVDDQRWLVASDGGSPEDQTRAILFTADGGKTWASPAGDADYFGGPLPIVQVGAVLLSAKHHGVNKSEDAGRNWAFRMESHTRMIGSAGEVFFREGDRQFIRGTRDRILSLEISDNLGQSWTSATGNLLQVMSPEARSLVTVSADRDPFAHVRLAEAWATTPDGRDVFLSLGKAGLYHGRLLWDRNGPRLAGIQFKPVGVPEGDARTQVIVTAVASRRKAPVQRLYADLGALGLGDVPLLDDGSHGDGAAGDKVYGNSFTIPAGTSAGPRTIGVVAEDQNSSISSASATFEVTSRAEKFTVWNGEQFAAGLSWAAPPHPLNSLKAQTDDAHSGKVALELHGEGGGFIGGGWNWFGWYPADSGTDIRKYGNLTFWVRYELIEGQSADGIEVSLVSNNGAASGAVDLGSYCQTLSDGQWHDVAIPLVDLYEGRKATNVRDSAAGADKKFDPSHCWMVNLHAWSPLDRSFSIYLDDIGFDNRAVRPRSQWAIYPEPRESQPLPADAPAVTAQVDIVADGTPISPYIYGGAMGDVKAAGEMGMTIMRAGGNPISALNWKHGYSSSGADWYFANGGKETPPQENWLVRFHGAAKAAGMESYISLPMMGRVAKDATSVAFDINKYTDQTSWAGKEQPTDPHANAGNGIQYVRGTDGQIAKDADGTPLTREIEPDPDDTSVAMSPEEQTDMLRFMIQEMKYGTSEQGGVRFVAMDNEPTLWSSTHRGMYPKGISYDELWERTRTYATLAKQIDPGLKIAGPTLWGWTAYFYSGKDQQDVRRSGGKLTWDAPPDFEAHGRVPLAKWYLQKLAEHKKSTGVQLVDILDWHFYPQTGHYMGGVANDPKWMESRVQETRVLWDPTWQDPSWMGTEVTPPKVIRLIPLMKQWINETGNQGMQTALGEYNFGGESDVSGGVAQVELLGIFAREGLDYALYWFAPAPNSSPYFAFKLFRNPDGKHTAFGDRYLPSQVSAPEDVSVHASRDSKTGRLSFVLVNKRGSKPAKVNLRLSQAVPEQELRIYEYGGTDAYIIGELPARKVSGQAIQIDLPPMSVQRFDLLTK
jgi:hypothetical protein